MMKGRTGNEIMAASKIDEGTDVNYGELTRKMAKVLNSTLMQKFNIIMRSLILTDVKMVHGK